MICLSWLWTAILLIFASLVTRITGVSQAPSFPDCLWTGAYNIHPSLWACPHRPHPRQATAIGGSSLLLYSLHPVVLFPEQSWSGRPTVA
jgi:hypothetical protein